MIKKELNDEIKKRHLLIFGYELFMYFVELQKDLQACTKCKSLMLVDFVEFLHKWQLISESFYIQTIKIIDNVTAEGGADDTCKSENV